MSRMRFTEEFAKNQREKELRQEREEESHLSGFEINVRRLEGLMLICQGDKDEAMTIVTGWVDEAKRRYDAKH